MPFLASDSAKQHCDPLASVPVLRCRLLQEAVGWQRPGRAMNAAMAEGPAQSEKMALSKHFASDLQLPV